MGKAKRRLQAIPVTTPLEPLKAYDRLTIISNVHFEHRGEPPRTVPVGHSRRLKEKVEPYQRRITVKETWGPIDIGWFEPGQVGCVVLENLEGRDLLENPTEAEQALIDSKVVEISYSKNSQECDLLAPGAIDVKWPADVTKLYARCQNGSASCKVHIISK